MKIYSFKNNTGSDIARSTLCALNSSKTMQLADASSEDTVNGMLGIAMYDIPTGSFGEFCIDGFIYLPEGGLTIGSIYYASTTGGGITDTMPTGDNIIRAIGYALSEFVLRFDPKVYSITTTAPTGTSEVVQKFYASDFVVPSTNPAALVNLESVTNKIVRKSLAYDDLNDLIAQASYQNNGEANTQAIAVKLRLKPDSTEATNNGVVFSISGTVINPGDDSDAVFGTEVDLILSVPDSDKEYETAFSDPITLDGGDIQDDSMIVIRVVRKQSDTTNDTLPDKCQLIDMVVEFNATPSSGLVPVLSDDMSSQANSESLGGTVNNVTYSSDEGSFINGSESQINYGSIGSAPTYASVRFNLTDYTANPIVNPVIGGIFNTYVSGHEFDLVLATDTTNHIKIYLIGSDGNAYSQVLSDLLTAGDYVLVYDDGSIYLYKDGSLLWSDTSTYPSGALGVTYYQLIIGGSEYPNRWATFDISLFEYYDVALTPEQIAAL